MSLLLSCHCDVTEEAEGTAGRTECPSMRPDVVPARSDVNEIFRSSPSPSALSAMSAFLTAALSTVVWSQQLSSPPLQRAMRVSVIANAPLPMPLLSLLLSLPVTLSLLVSLLLVTWKK